MKRSIYTSATLKLTSWYLLITMAISLSFSAVVYSFAASELANSLNSQSQRIYQAFPVFDDDPFFQRHSDLTRGEHHILLELAGFNAVVLIVAGFASYWLARRTLLPIQQSNERQRRFTADVSHELRTPLTALQMSTEVALMNPEAPVRDLRVALKSNLEEANRLNRLIQNLLRLSQLEVSDFQSGFNKIALDTLARQATSEVEATATAKHIKISNHVTAVTVRGDSDSLQELLVILMDNAIKYSPEHSKIELSNRADGQWVELSVTDHGQGIKSEDLEHVFNRFYRADTARSHGDEPDGFGLGLPIAKQIADLHEGRITLSSAPGHGTTATLHLPALPADDQPKSARVSTPHPKRAM